MHHYCPLSSSFKASDSTLLAGQSWLDDPWALPQTNRKKTDPAESTCEMVKKSWYRHHGCRAKCIQLGTGRTRTQSGIAWGMELSMGRPGLGCLAVEATPGQTAELCGKPVRSVGLVLLSHSTRPARPCSRLWAEPSLGSYLSDNRVVQRPQGDQTLGHLAQKQQRQWQSCCISSPAVPSLQESLTEVTQPWLSGTVGCLASSTILALLATIFKIVFLM